MASVFRLLAPMRAPVTAGASSRNVQTALRTSPTRRSVTTRSTVSTVGRVLRPITFYSNSANAEEGTLAFVKVAIDDPVAKAKAESGQPVSAFQTLVLPIRSEKQQEFWARVGPGSIVHGSGVFTSRSITHKDVNYPPDFSIRCSFLDVISMKEGGEAQSD